MRRRLGAGLLTTGLLLIASPAAHSSEDGGRSRRAGADGAIFSTVPLEFSPATIVSAHFLGAEPLIEVIDHPEKPGETMMFVDWPLGTRTQTGQLNRSLDSGQSFRLLYDRMCAQRSRPTCQTGGGGDTESDFNPFTETLFFADQQSAANEALASSLDYGDSFPPERQFTVTNAAAGVDREWLAVIDPAIASVGIRDVQAFMSYRGPETGSVYIQGIDTSGAPIPQPLPQLAGIVQRTGPLRVDTTDGPGRGWVYQPFRGSTPENIECPPCGLRVATAPADSYADPTAWDVSTISESEPTIFPWLALDDAGNAYAVWVSDGIVYLSASPISDPRNDPNAGGRPGTYWTEDVRVSLPEVGSAIFGEVTAGDEGRIAITYVGTTGHTGESAIAPSDTKWNTYAAVITNALDAETPPVVRTGIVSHRVVHTGRIHCRGGCPEEPTDNQIDDSLLDYIDIAHDSEGRVVVAFTDNNSTFATPEGRDSHDKLLPFSHVARQLGGPGLLSDGDPDNLSLALNRTTDDRDDATWPNATDGENLEALDLRGASVTLTEGELVVRVPLVNGTVDAMQRALETYNEEPQTTPAAARLQYVVRVMTADDIYHVSMETLENGTTAFFGGLLDENDELPNVAGDVVGAGYHRDEGFNVTGTLVDSTIELRAPLSQFGLEPKASIYNVTAFAMAGPEEQEEDLTNPMRTVDATPSFDALLLSGCDILGTGGNDLLVGTAAADLICGRGGDDVIRGGKGPDRLRGGPGSDTLNGKYGDDFVRGGPGKDALEGGRGIDVLRGNIGDDASRGGPRPDTLFGGAGLDLLFGGWGEDRLFGGADADGLRGGPGRDELNGGRGHDRCSGEPEPSTSCERGLGR